MKERVMITIDGQVRTRAKEVAGLVPFSRFIEDLLKKEIERKTREERDE